MKLENKFKRVGILLALLLTVFAYFLVNAGQYAFAFLIYVVLGGIGIFGYVFLNKLSLSGDLEGLGDHWVRNSLIGIGLGILTIILGSLVSFVGAIGIPSVPASVVTSLARFIIIVPGAMIFESVFFLDYVMGLLMILLTSLGVKEKPARIISLIIMSLLASLFHFVAYGGSLSATGGSFLSAFVMFLLFGILAEKQNDLAGAMTWHGVINAWIGFVKLNVIVVNFLPLIPLNLFGLG